MDSLWNNFFRSKLDEESLPAFLARVQVFAELEKGDLNYLEQLVHVRNYAANETVFEQDDPGTGMYIIRSGRVMIFTRDGSGTEEELTTLGSGDFFGETTIASPAPRTFSARTTENTELLGLFRPELLTTASKRPEIANRILFGLIRVISERLQTATVEIRRLQLQHNNQKQ